MCTVSKVFYEICNTGDANSFSENVTNWYAFIRQFQARLKHEDHEQSLPMKMLWRQEK